MGSKQPTVKRLCTEIQLFDLCEKGSCSSRDGRFCTDPQLLARFEALSEPDDRPLEQYLDDDMDDVEEGDGLEYDDDFGEDDYDDEE